jgi:hypothetical protein
MPLSAAAPSPPVAVAGRVVANPLHAVAHYLERYGGTITHYDFRSGTFDRVNPDLIRATRSPWMGSRISAAQGDWIIDRAATAPWSAIPLDAELKQADPLAAGGLFDAAEALWEHFWAGRPAGISTAKISKTLYLMRPALVPILDSYLIRFYRAAAREAAADIGRRRPSLGRFTTLYWEAIRRDILRGEDALRVLREILPASPAPLAQTAARQLSDLRLLDILAWAADTGGQPAPVTR